MLGDWSLTPDLVGNALFAKNSSAKIGKEACAVTHEGMRILTLSSTGRSGARARSERTTGEWSLTGSFHDDMS